MYTLKQYRKLMRIRNKVIKNVPNYIVSKVFSRKPYVKNQPYWAHIEPTNRCNLRC
ncbi:unnamed protein product, partial [marine sediment metagenome]